MTGRDYEYVAAQAVHGFVSANLAAAIRQVETDRGVAPNTYLEPVAYLDHRVPKDTRNVCAIWPTESEPVGGQPSLRDRLANVNVQVDFAFSGSDASRADATILAWATALRRIIAPLTGDPHVGTGTAAITVSWTGFNRLPLFRDDSSSRIFGSVNLFARVHDK